MTTDPITNLNTVWPELRWRHHGTGMLQAYLPGDDCRVHIWHPTLLLDGMVTSGAMHDHRFSFCSTVLRGSILHTRLHVQTRDFEDHGAHQLYSCPLEGAAGAACALEPGPRALVVMDDDEIFSAGTTYCVNKGEFHWARPTDDLAVTFVEIIGKDTTIRSRIVAPYGTTPVHAFKHEPNKPLMRELVFQAAVALHISLNNCLDVPLGCEGP